MKNVVRHTTLASMVVAVLLTAGHAQAQPLSSDARLQPSPSTTAEGIGISTVLLGVTLLGFAAAMAAGVTHGDDTADTDETPHSRPPVSDVDRTVAAFQTTEYLRQYGLSMINAAQRYATGGTGNNTLVAVFDTGADITHADLAPNIAQHLNHSYYINTPDVRDFSGHGTHVASIVAGAKNDLGSHGVAFDAQLMILQGLRSGPRSRSINSMNAWADAQHRAIDAGAVAINHSWTFSSLTGASLTIDGYTRSSLQSFLGAPTLSALRDSADAGLVTVFAAGNDGFDQVSVTAGIPLLFPELADHWLAVVAVDSTSTIAPYSNRCGEARAWCLAAPGSRITGAASSDAGYAPDAFIQNLA